ncbi:MAG: arylsulfatase [Peptoniphilaceae bacterium]|nr:arylsulfatase [Peptoniphilaceae bacterium]MDY6018261.1 arylsulfatase [Anaerococcus sp.]
MKNNIVLIMADQFRYDAINCHDNDAISTPTLNQWIKKGYDFKNAYSACPTCIPARASLLSGLSQESTGIVGYDEKANWNFPQQMGQVFADRGYYTKVVGKMHVNPERKRMGFHHIELHDGYLHVTRNTNFKVKNAYAYTDDYYKFLKEKLGYDADFTDYGLECNSWVARSFPYQEKYHPTNWAVTRAIDFLRTRDEEEPFFLKLSFVRPHSPLDPPEYYFNMYMEKFKNLTKENLENWLDKLGLNVEADSIDALKGEISIDDYRRMLAGYYGSVTHLDHQINRFMMAILEHGLMDNTIFVFTSDHGDQLSDHNLFRKGFAYQESIHVPFIVYDPGNNIMDLDNKRKDVEELVELRDILPSLLDFATGQKLDQVDGKSVKILMTKDRKDLKWREYLHGEHILGDFSNQFILKLPYKYIWYTQSGIEQLFDLGKDPHERIDLAEDPSYKEILGNLRSILIEELKDRPEGFVVNDKLVSGKKQNPLLPINEKYR